MIGVVIVNFNAGALLARSVRAALEGSEPVEVVVVDNGSTDGSLAALRAELDGDPRLRTLEQSTDGFHIAEADLVLRGPGDFLGTRQAGLPDFRVASLIRDTALLRAARDEAASRELLDEARRNLETVIS